MYQEFEVLEHLHHHLANKNIHKHHTVSYTIDPYKSVSLKSLNLSVLLCIRDPLQLLCATTHFKERVRNTFSVMIPPRRRRYV